MTIVGNQIVVSLDSILFATDFSPIAAIARAYVQALAARYQSQARLMHVVDLNAAFKGADAGLSIDIFRRFGEQSLANLGSELSAEKVRVETVLCEGTDPAEMILEEAGERRTDLLVIGTRGHKGVGQVRAWIDSRKADSSGQVSYPGHRAIRARAQASARHAACS